MSSSRATSIYSAPIEIKEDLRQTTKLGGCAVGSRAIYLRSFWGECSRYMLYQDIVRVFKRVAMSRGGFTRHGLFCSLAYLVVLDKDGQEISVRIDQEDTVDHLLERIHAIRPELPLHSEAAEKRLKEAEEREAKRYLEQLTPQAQAALADLNQAKLELEKFLQPCSELSQAARAFRVQKRIYPFYADFARVIMFIVLLVGVGLWLAPLNWPPYFKARPFGAALVSAAVCLLYGLRSYANNNLEKAKLRYAMAVQALEKRFDESSNFLLPPYCAHPTVITRMARVIREGRAQDPQQALEIVKSDLKKLNSNVAVSQVEYDEVVEIKPMFLCADELQQN